MKEETLATFHEAKKALADFIKLSYITNDADSTLTLTSDVSGDSIGAVLHQNRISFFSVKLNTTQRKYSTFKKITSDLPIYTTFLTST